MLGAVAHKGIDRKVRPQPGETVLVVGAGVIGQFAAQLCRLAGARVIVADLEESRLAVARQCGVAETVNASAEPLGEAAAKRTDGKGPDVAIDVTGEPDVLLQVIALTRVGGRVHAQGMYLEEVRLYFPETLFGRDLTLSATCGEDPSDAAAVMGMMAEGKLVYEPLLSDVMPVAEATGAYERVHDRPDEVLTVALEW